MSSQLKPILFGVAVLIELNLCDRLGKIVEDQQTKISSRLWRVGLFHSF